jgi:transcriptional regulator with XRE-family HTH domain
MGRSSVAVDRARRRIDADLRRVIDDLAAARRAAGLSLRAVGLACGVGKSTIARIESGATRTVDVRLLAAIGAAVGLDIRIRAYPAGDAIRDAGQQRLLGRLRARLDPSLTWHGEVPLPIGQDLRAWDAMIRGAGWHVVVEAETVLDDLQALERRMALKLRDGGEAHVILLVADTRRNRRVLGAAPGAFSTLTRDARATLRALAAGVNPGGGGIVIL